MLLPYFTKEKNEIISILVHLGCGVLCFFSVFVFIGWFYLVLISALPGLISIQTRGRTILMLSAYIMGMELLGRVLNAAPFVPYQVGSYYMLGIFTLAIFDHFKSARTNVGLLLLLLCVPGFFMISADDYINNFLNAFAGILCAALAAVYFSRQVYSKTDLYLFLKAAVLPVVSILVLVILRTPSFDESEFTLKANAKATGGFGANQISTILGAAACFILLPYLKGGSLFGRYKIIGLLLAGAFLFQGLLTFSRGGIMGCVIALLLAYLYIIFTDKKNLAGSLLRIVFFFILAIFLFNLTDQITGGKLSQRYTGETGGTIEGSREKDLKVITSGRNELVEAEWYVFRDNILFGVGPGNGYEARKEYVGRTIASHTEVTRLISEQGLPGLLIASIFLFYPFGRIAKAKTRETKYYLIAFFLLAVITSFHSSMRTMITPLLWGLGCASFVIPDRTVLLNKLSKHQGAWMVTKVRQSLSN